MKKIKVILLLAVLPAILTIHGCKKDDKNDPAPAPTPSNPSGITSSSNPELNMKMDGIAFTYKDGTNDIQQSVGSSGSPYKISLGASFDKVTLTDHEEIIWFGKGFLEWSSSVPLDSAKFVNFFNTGSYSYTPVSYYFSGFGAPHGIEVVYKDPNDVYWSTAFGTADQTGSTFSIIQTKFYRYLGEKYIKVKFSFNCKLYDGNGNMKTITDGNAIMDFWTDYGN